MKSENTDPSPTNAAPKIRSGITMEQAVYAGWNACVKDIYRLSESIIEDAEKSSAVGGSVLKGSSTNDQEVHSKGFYAGSKDAAKSFAKSFSSFQASDADRVTEALADLRAGVSGALDEPVAWQRKHPRNGWQPVDFEDIEHYRNHGQEVRALFAGPVIFVQEA